MGHRYHFYVPDSLPALPGSVPNRSNIERMALENRVDLAAGRLEMGSGGCPLTDVTGQTRMLSDAEVGAGVEIERENGETERSPVVDVAFSIPVYDTSGLISRRGKLEYQRSANTLAQSAINARSEARSAYTAVTGKHIRSPCTGAIRSCPCAGKSMSRRCSATTAC